MRIDSFKIQGFEVNAIAIPEGESTLEPGFRQVEVKALTFDLARYAGYENDSFRFFFEKSEKEILDYLQSWVNETEKKYPLTTVDTDKILLI